MKPYSFGIYLLILVACSEKGLQEASDQMHLSFTVSDTVLVDPGDDFLYLQENLWGAQWVDDGQYLYNFNRRDNAVEIIDLDQLKLQKKVLFEREGPNGTGGYVQSMYYVGDGNIALAEHHQIGIFDLNASKLATHNIQDQEYAGDTLLENESLEISGILDEGIQHFITVYRKGFGQPLGIAKLRLNDYTLTKIPVPELVELENFRLELSGGPGISVAHPATHISYRSGKLLLSSNAVNELFVYDPKKDNVQHFTFHSYITPNSQKHLFKNQVHSNEEFNEALKERGKEVSYMHFTYDTTNSRYYRLSQFFVREGADGPIFKPVLTIFDQDFNQLFETDELPINKVYRRYFAKDGKLYLYENIMDEMAFIVLEIEEEHP